MYERFYGLATDPFRLSPDHRFCFNHNNFARAKAYIDYALHRAEGFVMITGKPGTGKTMLVHDLLDRLTGKDVKVAMLMSTRLGAEDLLRMTAYAFGLDSNVPNKAMVLQKLMEFFSQQHHKGKRALLIIDESQDLSASALEELRLLTNLQHAGQPLLQIVLIGQETLRELVRSPEMEQLHQRLLAAWHLEPLAPLETVGYIQHRLEKAGWQGDPEFKPGVMQLIHDFSGGVPRMINLVCSRLLLHGFIEELHVITVADAQFVVGELRQEELAPRNFLTASDFQETPTQRMGSEASEEEQARSTLDDADRPRSAFPAHPRPTRVTWNPFPPSDRAPIIAAGSAELAANVNWSRIDTGLSMSPERSPRLDVTQALAPQANIPEQIAAIPVHRPAPIAAESGGEDSPPPGIQPRSSSSNSWRWLLGLGFGLTGLVAVLIPQAPATWQPLVDHVEQWVRNAPAMAMTTFNGPQRHNPAPQASPIAPAAEASLEQMPLSLTEKSAPSAETPAVTSLPPPIQIGEPSTAPEQGSPVAPPSEIHPLPSAEFADQVSAISNAGLASVTPSMAAVSPSQETIAGELGAIGDEDPFSLAETDSTPRELDVDGLETLAEDGRHRQEPSRVDAVVTVDSEIEAPDEKPQESMTVYVLFGWNSAEVETRFEPMLAEMIAMLTQSKNAVAEVIGYSDPYGDAAYNLELSRRRANAVADYLVEHGTQRERLRVAGRGPIDLDALGENSLETVQSRGRMVALSVSVAGI